MYRIFHESYLAKNYKFFFVCVEFGGCREQNLLNQCRISLAPEVGIIKWYSF
jgi:hypothetical protein